MKEENRRDIRMYPVLFRYPKRGPYYYVNGSSGYPSAEYRLPDTRPGDRIIVRETQE